MKKTGIIFLLLASVACGDELADLRAENAALRAENERLKKTLEKLTSAELEVTPEVSEETDDKKPEINQVRQPHNQLLCRIAKLLFEETQDFFLTDYSEFRGNLRATGVKKEKWVS